MPAVLEDAVHDNVNEVLVIFEADKLSGAVGNSTVVTLFVDKKEPGITSLGAAVDWPGFAQATERLSGPLLSFIKAST